MHAVLVRFIKGAWVRGIADFHGPLTTFRGRGTQNTSPLKPRDRYEQFIHSEDKNTASVEAEAKNIADAYK